MELHKKINMHVLVFFFYMKSLKINNCFFYLLLISIDIYMKSWFTCTDAAILCHKISAGVTSQLV